MSSNACPLAFMSFENQVGHTLFSAAAVDDF